MAHVYAALMSWVFAKLFRLSAVLTVSLRKRTAAGEQGMIQSNNKHADTCVVSNEDSVSTCKAMAFFMDR